MTYQNCLNDVFQYITENRRIILITARHYNATNRDKDTDF